MELECFSCEWYGDDPAHPLNDPDDLRCPECGERLVLPEAPQEAQ